MVSSTQPLTKVEAAYNEIRVMIEDGRLATGARLLIAELQSALGMSPTPIREALRLLQRDGLVEHTPHYGTIVADFTQDRLEGNHLIREALEPLATRLAAERATNEELKKLRRLHEQFEQAVRDNSRKGAGLNAEWHMTLYNASHNQQLVEFIDRLWIVRGKTKWLVTHAAQSVEDHEAILEQLEGRNPAQAAQLMKRHLMSVDSRYGERAKRLDGSP